MTVESDRWAQYAAKSEEILYYHLGFFNMREADDLTKPVSDKCIEKLKCLIRLICWVETKHGQVGPNQPGRDPMQSGNPDDKWWQEFTGQKGQGSRFIGGPDKPNYWANELCRAFQADLQARIARLEADSAQLRARPGNLPPDRFFEILRSNQYFIDFYKHLLANLQWTCSDAAKPLGHRSEKFEPCMSFFWGTLYLLHKIRSNQFYKIDCAKCDDMVTKAIDYNGGGDPKYGEKLRAAQKEIGCCTD